MYYIHQLRQLLDIKSKKRERGRDSSRDFPAGLRYIVIKRTIPVSYFRMIHRCQTSSSQLRIINALRGCARRFLLVQIAAASVPAMIFRWPRSFRCIRRESPRDLSPRRYFIRETVSASPRRSFFFRTSTSANKFYRSGFIVNGELEFLGPVYAWYLARRIILARFSPRCVR